jgi:arylsulfatase A-like enzyme
LLGLLAGGATTTAADNAADDTALRPNLIILYCDNLGYGDVGCFGSTRHRTPHIDRMAREGMRLTSFYSASGVCTPSRASLMTGCYPRRVGLDRTEPDGAVLRPVSPNGLHPDEVTIAEILRDAGYATACIGKWHLGDQPPFLPTRQGFGTYFGIPYSDDMTARDGTNWPPLPLMRDERVLEAPVDRNTLTRRYTEEAIRFLSEPRDRPFFLYLPHAMPGSTQRPFASRAFQSRSANGPYGDSVEELDWSTGEILAAIERLGIDSQTLVVWTSDNGAPRRNPPQGSNAPLSGWGYSTREGGMRVPCVVRWLDRVPAGTTSAAITTTMDLLPTFAHLAGASLPAGRVLDGRDIWPLLRGTPGARSPHEAFFYYHMDQLQAVRSGRWKLYLASEARRTNLRDATAIAQAELYDLQNDIGETDNVADRHPEIVSRLNRLADQARADLGDGPSRGHGQRSVGRMENPAPVVQDSDAG